jgi:hypothetical protein
VLLSLLATTVNSVKDEPSKTPFYIAGGLLALWAVTLFAIGMRRHDDWPSNAGSARVIMLISALLVAAAMACAVITS